MFLTNHPAMLISDYLIITDLHLGITRQLYESGVSVPSQVRKFLDRLQKLKKISKAKNLVILGDLKHKVPGTSWQEYKEIPDFLQKAPFQKIILVKGNHDAGIEKLLYGDLKQKVAVKKTFRIGPYLFTHGHRKISKAQMKNVRTIIIGHNQPAVLFRDRIGASYIEPVWVKGILNITSSLKKTKNTKHKSKQSKKQKEKTRIIIMPAFNELAGYGIINKKNSKPMGPIAKNIDLNRTHAFLLDGTDIGSIEDLKIRD